MPQYAFPTVNPVGAAIGDAVLVGRQWNITPQFPSPQDTTTQAATYRAANVGKSLPAKVWLGVKYGQDPIGALRFKPCQPYTYPAGTYDMSRPPVVPHQTFASELGADGRPGLFGRTVGAYNWPAMGTREGEDCLTLNIFAPVMDDLRPVVFMIHGGGWGVYHARGPQQDGSFYAAHKGQVVVTPEYRLSTFGHFPHPDIIADDEPSVAYTDIKEALRWTYNNIEKFGGDPNRICIAGTSAGGAAVQLLLEDDECQDWIFSYWIGSGGGGSRYLGPEFYTERTQNFERAIRAAAPFLSSLDPAFRTVQQAIDANGFVWAMQNAVRHEHVQAMADIGAIVTAASVNNVIAGTGNLVASRRDAHENFFPFKRSEWDSGIAAARGGRIRKPGVVLYAECEALNLIGNDYASLRSALNSLSTETLDSWAQRVGFATYADWLAAPWQPVGGWGALSTAQFKTTDPLVTSETEGRRVLYTHAIFGYPAWRVARGATQNGQLAWLVVNNFSANSAWAGHSTEVQLMFGTVDWAVGFDANYPTATPPGDYANIRMDVLYMSEYMMTKLARLAATGNPNGSYTYSGFDLFAGNPPADGGNIASSWTEYTTFLGGWHNNVGKYVDPINNLNAGTFDAEGNPAPNSQQWARSTFARYMHTVYIDYMTRLEV